ncbi:MAG: fumarate hydratase, partial [Oscillospiraceae bacterium]
MRDINVNDVSLMVSNLCMHANIILPATLEGALRAAKNSEKSEIGKEVLGDICHNFTVALTENIPVCQDTGMAVIFIEIGQEVHFVGGNLVDAINAGVANGYTDNHLRCSIVSDPFERVNTANNAPAIIHTTIVGGDKVKIDVCPKGFGSENMSAIKMFTPSATYDEVCEFVVETISK